MKSILVSVWITIKPIGVIFTIVAFLISCKEVKNHEPNNSNSISGIGYVISSEEMNERFFDNGIFYFIPIKKIDTLKPLSDFNESNFKLSYGFVLYSSFYIRLINSMSYDLIAYELDANQKDPNRLNIEFRRCLPVKMKFTYDTVNLKNQVQKDSILIYDGRKLHFAYKFIGQIKIQSLEILSPKDDDLTGNEALFVKRQDGIFGIVKNK